MLIVFAGLVGHSGLGGQAWATMNYLAGKVLPAFLDSAMDA
jgi:hypothetical protein